MTRTERLLRWVLWLTGAVLLLALVGVFMPYTLMQSSHARAGMGPLPELPVIDYLARSVSAFYALVGGLCFVLATDVRRYRPVLIFLGVITSVYSVGIIVVDHLAGLPPWWTWGEGPATLPLGVVVAALAYRLPPPKAAD